MDLEDIDDDAEGWDDDDRVTLIEPPTRKYKPYGQSHSRKPEGLLQVPWEPCPNCALHSQRKGLVPASMCAVDYGCERCLGVGFLDVPTSNAAFFSTLKGSDARVIILAARNAHGVYPVIPQRASSQGNEPAGLLLSPT